MHRIFRFFHVFAFGLCFALLFWSFTQTDRALYYSSSSSFVALQQWLWGWGASRVFSTMMYVVLLGLSFLGWIFVVRSRRYRLPVSLIVVSALMLALCNPGLSYDLFNYMFDARLVLWYHLDPHTSSAITFQSIDPWVSYMRNTFFPTTYGYMWTALSLVPGALGMGKFSLTFLFFKLWSLSALLALFAVDVRLLRRLLPRVSWKRLSLFFVNPLVLIETLMNGHNDIWMMLLAHSGLLLLLESTNKSSKKVSPAHRVIFFVGSLLLLAASTQVKRATLLLLPIWGIVLVSRLIPERMMGTVVRTGVQAVREHIADIAGILLFLPLFSDLSRQFHPWYLLWSFSFVPFMKNRFLRSLLILFSLTSTLRYVPILWIGVYSEQQFALSKAITWSAIPLVFIYWIGIAMMKRIKQQRRV